MKLFFIIAGKSVFGQMVTGQMTLTGMEQVFNIPCGKPYNSNVWIGRFFNSVMPQSLMGQNSLFIEMS